MLKLMKYEMRKTIVTKLVLLGLAVAIEGLFLYGVMKNDPQPQSVALMLLFVLACFGVLFIGVQSIVTLHRDMNTRQSYMLFMTPNSSYRILGAKVLENGLSTLITGACFLALGFADVTLLLARNQSLDQMLSFFRQFVSMMGAEINLNFFDILWFTVFFLSSWLSTVVMAYLADVLASSLLNGKKGGLFICFIFFIILSLMSGKLMELLPRMASVIGEFIIQSAFYLVLSGVIYFVTARLMDKYLSV